MQPFTELGTSGSMVVVDSATREMHLRCAKRCSASVRSAVAFEEVMEARQLECVDLDCAAVAAMISEEAGGGDPGAFMRANRDAKVTQQQRSCAVLCGDANMLCVPIVGKAVRLWEEWFALCSFCGALVRFYPISRVGAEICCLRCDPKLLFRKEKHEEATAAAAPSCRFCGKARRLCARPTPHAPRPMRR